MLEKWFQGSDGPGMTMEQARAALGQPLHPAPTRASAKVKTLRALPRALEPLARVAHDAVATVRELAKATVVEGKGRLSPAIYTGVKGAALVYGKAGTQRAIPVVLYNPRGFVLLSEAESRQLVTGGVITNASGLSRLDGGIAPVQDNPPPPPAVSPAPVGLIAGLAALALAIAGGVGYVATR